MTTYENVLLVVGGVSFVGLVFIMFTVNAVRRLQNAVRSHGESLDNDHARLVDLEATYLSDDEVDAMDDEVLSHHMDEIFEDLETGFSIPEASGITLANSTPIEMVENTEASEAFESFFADRPATTETPLVSELLRDRRSSRICLSELEIAGLDVERAGNRGDLVEARRAFERCRSIFARLQNCVSE